MPLNARPNRWTATEAVEHVLAGMNADGSAPLGLSIPFTKDAQARAAASELIRRTIESLNGIIRPEHLTPLTAKLLAHLTKCGLQSPDEIAGFPIDSLLIADITELPQHLLDTITTVKAKLRSYAETISLPSLTTSGNNLFYEATSVSLPALKNSGDNIFTQATTVSLPSLTDSGDNFLEATTVSLPALKISGDNIFTKATSVSLPALKNSGDNLFYEATTVSMPSLKTSGIIVIPYNATVDLAALETINGSEEMARTLLDQFTFGNDR